MVGDYISREAAKEAIYKTAEEYDEYDKCDRIAIIALNNADEILNDIPAANVVEVRHASWIEDGYYNEPCVCSNCGEPCKDTVMGKPRWNYYPSCGARCDL